jgi:choice-of-anchor B domain-containing protein
MRLVKSAILLFAFFMSLCPNGIYAQLGNSNMYSLANLNQHYTSTLYSACWGYRAPNGREYAILGCPTGTAFVDITDTTNIHEVDFQTGLNSAWREMKVYSHYAYIVSEANNSGVQIVDLQYLPDSVHLVTVYTFSGYNHTHSIQQSGPYVYLNGGNATPGGADVGGVTVLDLTANPEAPVHRGSWSNYYVHDCRVRGDTIWACNIYNPPGTISVINATNKDALTTITSWINNPNPFPHNCDLLPGRTYILTTDETQTPPGKLKVWDISNLSNVTFVTSWQPTGITTAIVHNVERYGNYALVAHYSAGVRVVNISNPTTPVEAAWYDTYPSNNNASYNGCWGVFGFPSGKIIASDRQTGLYVLKTTFSITGIENNNNQIPDKFELKQNYPNPFNPSTTIEYSTSKNAYVTIKVFDEIGRQVGILVDGYEYGGIHKVNYDASRLASGIYFYTMQTDGFYETKKMTLIK